MLRPGGVLVLTCKFRGIARDRAGWAARLEAALGAQFGHVQLYWLLANTVNERTLVAVRSEVPWPDAKAPAAPAGVAVPAERRAAEAAALSGQPQG
jgi:hypothetical protein